MAFYTINKLPIFFSGDRFAKTDKPFLESLSAHEIIMLNVLTIDGKFSKNRIRLEEIRFAALTNDFSYLSQEEFAEKWVSFEFLGRYAQELYWEVLSDCLSLNKIGFIRDIRDFSAKLDDDMSGKNYLFPQGTAVNIIFNLQRTSMFSVFSKKTDLSLRLQLDKVDKITGSLSNLKIHTSHYLLEIGPCVSINYL